MAERWERHLRRWVEAGLLEAGTAERIRAWEAQQAESRGLRWPVVLAVAFGAILLAAGILLFVAAHWDDISPAARFSLVLLMVAAFHVAGALLAERFAVLSTALHAVGTACLGAGIFLAGQIFHLQEHWPAALMLWALGAWVGWGLFRNWVQALFAAVLTPAWLVGEWSVAVGGFEGNDLIVTEGLLLLAATYLTARTRDLDSRTRQALAWVGGIALIPCALFVVTSREFDSSDEQALPLSWRIVGWAIALAGPLVVAWMLRRRAAWLNVLTAAWVVLLGSTAIREESAETLFLYGWRELGPYGWGIVGSVALVGWGLHEARKERINLGIIGFAVTVLVFYFSNVMDKLGRATSLMGLGVLFLVGGWMLERTRRRLVARVTGGAR